MQLVFAAIVGIVYLAFEAVRLPFVLLINLTKAYNDDPDRVAKRSRQETLEAQVQAHQIQEDAKIDVEAIVLKEAERVFDLFEKLPAYSVVHALTNALIAHAQTEDPTKPPRFDKTTDPMEVARQKDILAAYLKRMADPSILEIQLGSLFNDVFVSFYTKVTRPALFDITDGFEETMEPRSPFFVQLLELLPYPDISIEAVILPFYAEEPKALGLFPKLKERFDRNICELSNLPFTKENRTSTKLITPTNFRGPPEHAVHNYLKGTRFEEVFHQLVPFEIKPEQRLEHWHLMAPTGWGKTQTLQHIIYHDLTGPDPPALVVVEPKGDMIAALSKLQIFAKKPERLAIIDPAYNPQLNMFASRADRLDSYDQTVREEIEGRIIRQYGYIFGALDADVSHNQSTALSYVVKLVLSLRGDMHTFLDVLNDPAIKLEDSDFKDAILKLDPFAITFFNSVFFKGTFPVTRRALASKLLGLPAISPAFGRMFTAKENRLDMFERIQTPGSLTLVNTRQTSPKDDASIIFGRYIIAQTMAAAFERAAIPERKRKPAFLIVDEAGSYFDDSIEDILVQARSMGLGILFAHQFLAQLKGSSLKSSVLGMPAIKFAAPIEEDLSTMASNMRTSSDFLRSMKRVDGKATQFGVFVRGETSAAVRIQVPFLTVENAPQMSEKEHAALIAKNRERFSGDTTTRKPEMKPVETPPEGNHEF